MAADVSQPAEVERVASEALQRLGDIDILVNNAGATWGRRPGTIRWKPGTR